MRSLFFYNAIVERFLPHRGSPRFKKSFFINVCSHNFDPCSPIYNLGQGKSGKETCASTGATSFGDKCRYRR
jgi:hypothetical protein